MKIAVTVWGDRISPLFDASRQVLIATIDHARIIEREVVAFDPGQPSTLAKALIAHEVAVLICGAVSRVPAAVIAVSGIRLIPFITGKVDRVLNAYARGAPLAPTFVMPGCLKTTTANDTPSTH